MTSSARSKLGGGGIPRRGEGGGQLLQELEALSQALYKNIPVQSTKRDASAPAYDGSERQRGKDTSERDFMTKLSQQLPSAPSSAVKPPLSHARHSVSGFRSSAASTDEGEARGNKARSERSRRSQGFERQASKEMGSFPEWLEDNINFSQKLEAPLEKKSIWNWKPFRALAHIGQQRFNCGFSAHIHGIEGLPSRMNGMRLTVHFKHKDISVHTLPSRVFQGSVEFEETLHHKCAIFGSRKPSQGIKYMSKSFTLTVVALDMDELELGKHRLDLSRLLPESIDEKSDEENANTWTTSFKLSGKGKGGSLLVTFGYEIMVSEKESMQVGNTSARFGDSPARRALRSFNSLPNSPNGMLRSRPMGMPLVSPAVSESNSELTDFLGMDHLSLDETYNQEDILRKANIDRKLEALPDAEPKFNVIADPQAGFSQSDSLLAPRTPGQSVESSDFNNKISSSQLPTNLEDGSSEDDAEFVIEDRGVEMSPYSGEVQTTTNRHSDDAVQTPTLRLSDDDAEVQSEFNTAGTEEALFEGNWQLQEDADVLTAAAKMSPQDEHSKNSDHIEQEESDLGREQDTSDLENILGQPFLNEEDREDDVHLINDGSWDSDLPGDAIGYDCAKPTYYLQSNDDGDLATFEEGQNPPEDQGLELPLASTGQEVAEKTKTPEFDDEADLVTVEFLEMLQGVQGLMVPSSDSESDSPRALLLKQFEQEALLEGGFGLDSNLPKGSDLHKVNMPLKVDAVQIEEKGWQQEYTARLTNEDNELAAIMDAAESELKKAAQTMRSKARAKMLEDAEAEALMQEWGLDERAFASSPPKSTDYHAFGNASGRFVEAPPLAYGLGSVVPTRDGGELRSMSSTHFQSAYSGGQLVMHVSKPVAVPAEMGSSALDILKRMAASGVENMAMQAMLSMPLEDITGKSVHQIAFEGQTALELVSHRYAALGPGHDGNGLGIDYASQSMKGGFLSDSHPGLLMNTRSSSTGKTKGRRRKVGDEDIVSLDDLAPVAMEKIEALALEGLKIQSDMAEEDAPYSIDAMPWKEADTIGGRRSRNDGLNLLDGVAATHLLEGSNLQQEDAEGGDGFMSMAISLEEWMRLDAGLYDEAETSENTLAILAAHNANHKNLIVGATEQGLVQNKGPKPADGNGGFMGDTLTLAMLVQLRDPLRNYEPVGAPMMALVQAERILVPPRPKLWRRVSVKGNNEDDEDHNKSEQQPQFKITGVHISGLKSGEDNKEDKKKLWGNQKQQQSGSRWLLANGMAKTAKPALLKSKPAPTTTKAKQSESLWSISSRIEGNGKKWQPSSARNSLVRNPDVIFSKSTFRKR
ncbi:hypothetical protein O6H91_07G118300 [Diphasiastrum complanatum]|uniref:Uncharacterized protein n=1 Tax=Diphasiastrum complanatum TaxID=34168 RepID=A0ACC2D986_DIPCM|nr:hypothetical protein O6H91_07G118300 [Diphasiastrum complanatum]